MTLLIKTDAIEHKSKDKYSKLVNHICLIIGSWTQMRLKRSPREHFPIFRWWSACKFVCVISLIFTSIVINGILRSKYDTDLPSCRAEIKPECLRLRCQIDSKHLSNALSVCSD